MLDLLVSEPFTHADIITLQDPSKLEKFNISAFYHVQHLEQAKSEFIFYINKACLF